MGRTGEAEAPGPFWQAAMPALREDVRLLPWTGGPAARYLVEDLHDGRLLQLDEAGYFLCQHLNGSGQVSDLLQAYEDRFGARIGPSGLEAFLRHLAQQNLLQTPAAMRRSPTVPEIFLLENLLPVPYRRVMAADRLLGWLAQRLRWMFTVPMHVLATLLCLAAIYVVGRTILYRPNLLSYQGFHSLPFLVCALIVSWDLVPSIRMLAQGIACKHYGGQVQEVGVSFYFRLFPFLTCDVADLVWMQNKRHRGWTIFAGVYAQGLTWAVGALAWSQTASGSGWNTWWLATWVISGVMMFTTTAIPLVDKTCGYMLLVNWLEKVRLMERAAAVTGAWLYRRPLPEPMSRREHRRLLAFGLGAFVWNMLLWVLFFLIVWTQLVPRYHETGVLASMGVMVVAWQKPLGEGVARLRPIRWLFAWDRRARRWFWRVGVLVLLGIVLMLPYPYESGGPFGLLPGTWNDLTCEVDGGRITRVFVREGQAVVPDQPVAQIDGREYERNVQITQAQLEYTEAQLKLLLKRVALLAPPTISSVVTPDQPPPNIEEVEALEAERRRLRALLTDFQRQVELTTLRAGIAGRVATPHVEQKEGQYLKKGDIFATVERDQAIRVEIQVPESDWSYVQVGAKVRVTPWAYPHEIFPGRVIEVSPIAAVPVGSTATTVTNENSVRVVAELPNPDARLKGKLTGYAKIQAGWRPVGWVFTHVLVRWFQVQVWYWIP